MSRVFFFFFLILILFYAFPLCDVVTIGHHPQEELAKFGYRSSEKKVKKKNLRIPLLLFGKQPCWNLQSKYDDFKIFKKKKLFVDDGFFNSSFEIIINIIITIIIIFLKITRFYICFQLVTSTTVEEGVNDQMFSFS